MKAPAVDPLLALQLQAHAYESTVNNIARVNVNS